MSFLSTLSGVRIAQVVGVGASGYLSGMISSLSLVTIPALMLTSPDVAPRQWATVYKLGSSIAPALATVAELAYLYLAYYSNHPTEAYAYTAAGLCTIAIVPFTLMAMVPTNKTLQRLAEKKEPTASVAEGDRVTALLKKWKYLNLVRAMWPSVGLVVGLLALSGSFA